MTEAIFTYRVYINGEAAINFQTEGGALNYVESAASIHRDADFIIEKTEKIFDSSENSDDRDLLYHARNPNSSNTIHASIHPEDWDIERDDNK